MYVVLTLLSIVPLLIAGQVVWLFLSEGAELRARGERQASSYQEIPAMRGAILDRAGRVLAVNTARYDLALDPTVAGFTSAVARTFFEKLSKLTGTPASSFSRRVRERSSPQYVLLVRGMSEAQKEEVEGWKVPGLVLHPQFARRYNYGRTTAHVLGHVDADNRGIAGIELQFDAYLRGEPGRRTLRRDRLGVRKALVGGRVVEPKHGETVVLTIDLIRQTILEEELARGVAESGARWGTAIAMDPHTGAVLAMANVPTYDPNQPGAYSTEARRNRAITDRIEPGSTFKVVTAIAAVEQGVVGLQDSIDTGPGWMVFHGRTLRDSHPLGKTTFEEIIVESSNIGMAKVVERLDDGVFYQYVRNLGFGQPTWIDLPGEVGGVLRKPSSWSGSTKSSMSRGYGIDATPLQVLTAYCALANGGLLVHPYVVAERRDVTGRTIWKARVDSVRRAFEKETAEQLIPAFEKVVLEGTAKRASVMGLPIAGKTGTAMKAAGGSYSAGAYRASFVGFFPSDDPVVALIVVLDEPRSSGYGGVVSAPVFQRIASRWIRTFPRLAARVAPADSLPSDAARPVPAVVGAPLEVAAARLRATGYLVEAPSEAAGPQPVAAQYPEAGTVAAPGTVVRLTVAGDSTERMPDLTGASAREAVYWLSRRGVRVRLEGQGTVVGQSPGAGEPLPARAVLRCR